MPLSLQKRTFGIVENEFNLNLYTGQTVDLDLELIWAEFIYLNKEDLARIMALDFEAKVAIVRSMCLLYHETIDNS